VSLPRGFLHRGVEGLEPWIKVIPYSWVSVSKCLKTEMGREERVRRVGGSNGFKRLRRRFTFFLFFLLNFNWLVVCLAFTL
jgi:hypothetical protein